MKTKNILIKSKKGDGVFGMSFGMIFSIILIVFFFSAAFIGIRAFLNFQTQAQIGMFFQDIQTEVDNAWNSPSAAFPFNRTLPSGVEYVCFVNVSAPVKNAANIEKEIFSYIKSGYTDPQKNIYLYAPDKDYGMNWATLKHLDMTESNPQCISVNNGIFSVRIERKFEDKLPRIIG